MTDTAHTPANPDALPFDPPHAKLPQNWNWDADGNLTLLETPLLPGYVSRRAADADLARYTRMAIRLCGAGWTLIGGFVGARERLLLDDVAKAHPAFRLVRLEPGPLTESRLDSRLAAAHHAGRLLHPSPLRPPQPPRRHTRRPLARRRRILLRPTPRRPAHPNRPPPRLARRLAQPLSALAPRGRPLGVSRRAVRGESAAVERLAGCGESAGGVESLKQGVGWRRVRGRRFEGSGPPWKGWR